MRDDLAPSLQAIAEMPGVGMRELRRAQVVATALRSIEEVGLPSTTIASVARRANLSVEIVSHYFGDRNGLLETTMRHVLRDHSSATACRRAAASDDPRARLLATASGNFDATQVDSPVTKRWLAFWALSMHEPALNRLHRINARRLRSNLCAEFARVLPLPDARRAATGLAALMDGLWLRGPLSGAPMNAKEALCIMQEYVDLCLARAGKQS